MTYSRAHFIAALAATPLAVSGCARGDAIVVGSKNFTESIVVAEIYAQALERAGLRVVRKLDLGSTQIVLAAMQRGDIDIYPEYTGTALIDVLHHEPLTDPKATYETVRDAFARTYDLIWLSPAPANDSQGLATTRAISERYRLRTISQLAALAPRLRLATIPEFLTRPDGIPGLRRVYGGFSFASVRTYDIALKYQALLEGAADVATAFTTDGTIATQQLVVLEDDKHLWPPYNIAPVVRPRVANQPLAVAALARAARGLDDRAMQQMNARVEDHNADPADVAAAFLGRAS